MKIAIVTVDEIWVIARRKEALEAQKQPGAHR